MTISADVGAPCANSIGRCGQGGLRQELLLDPETAEVLNERQVMARQVQGLRAPVGIAIEDIVYTKRAVTDATVRP